MKFPEEFRVVKPELAGPRISRKGDPHGMFFVLPNVLRKTGALLCIASSGSDWEEMAAAGVPVPKQPAWEHVSVSPRIGGRCPTWEEMCYVKSLFWNDDECVVQYHPPKADHVNQHRYCLHLWRPVGVEVLRPPSICVG